MSVPATYADLQTKVIDLLHRTGDSQVTALAPDWIGYAESEMQTEIAILDLETSATVVITGGTGTLPSGYDGMRSVYWVSSPNHPMTYITPDVYDEKRVNTTGDGYEYTITGSSILTTPMGDGSVVLNYLARFTPLSSINASNALLASYPDLYVYGALKHACVWLQDDAGVQKYGVIFQTITARINKNNEQKKYGHALAVRAR